VPALALIYHDVVPTAEQASSGFTVAGAAHYKLTPEQFESHLAALDGLDVVLTFDDGGASALAVADALERHGRRGTFFVTAGYVGTPAFLSRDGVRELHERGHAIGSHSHTHPNLTQLPAAEIAEEWRLSKEALEEILRTPVRSASTPGGFYSRAVAHAAFAQGYDVLYTSEPWRSPRNVDGGIVHGRFAVVESTPPAKVVALASGSRAAVWGDAARWQAKKAAKRALGPVYARVRARVLG
jgi:peptidoglycan/xylan/chitin deacetylase (PgdA/CDA1 family)